MSQFRTLKLEGLLSQLNDFDPNTLGRIQLGKYRLDNEVTESLSLIKKITYETINIVANSLLVDHSRMEAAIESYINTLNDIPKYPDEKFINERTIIDTQIKNKTKHILTLWGEVLPYKFTELLTAYNNYNIIFQGISNRISEIETTSQIDDVIQKFETDSKKSIASFKESSQIITAELANERTKIEDLIKESAFNKELLEQKIKKFQEEYNSIFSDITLLKQTHLLKDKIKENGKSLIYWKAFIFLISIAILALSLNFISNLSEEINVYTTLLNLKVNNIDLSKDISLYVIIKNSIIRMFIVGFLVYILKVSIKLHNAISHNIWVLNQKIFSLDAARDLTFNMPESKDKKDIYSLAATEIFKQTKTGFLFKDDDKIDLSFVDKIKSFTK